jgi:hypothetical protein
VQIMKVLPLKFNPEHRNETLRYYDLFLLQYCIRTVYEDRFSLKESEYWAASFHTNSALFFCTQQTWLFIHIQINLLCVCGRGSGHFCTVYLLLLRYQIAIEVDAMSSLEISCPLVFW